MLGIWSAVLWGLLEEEQIDPRVAFSENAVELFQTPFETPAGEFCLIRGAIAEPPAQSQLWRPMYEAAGQDLGHDPTVVEIRDWLLAPEVAAWMDLPTVEEKVADPWYRTYLADHDPFFEENIEPFASELPMVHAEPGGSEWDRTTCDSLVEPIVETLTGWGWEIYTYDDPDVWTNSNEGPGHTFVGAKILEILYPEGVPPELAIEGSAP